MIDILLGLTLLATVSISTQTPEGGSPATADPAPVGEELSGDELRSDEFVLRGAEGQPLLFLPNDEKLIFRVVVDVAFFDAALGLVTQTCKVKPYAPSVLAPPESDASDDAVNRASDARPPESATIAIEAKGEYALFELDTRIESRHLPQEWPATVYRQVAQGSSKRRRENMIGVRDGVPTSSYRKDTSRGAPDGTRIWRESTMREVPADTLDMLSAVFACRTLIREGVSEIVFPMIEKDRLWELTLRRGKESRIRTGAGVFDAVEILLIPGPWRDEEIEESKQAKFEGLFGMQGSIHVWVDKKTGVTIRIQGDLPAGPFTLGVDVLLDSYSGTPADFKPLGKPSKK